MLKPFTADYEHFADPKTGLLPWLAGIVRVLIKEQNDEALQKLVNDIASTAESLYDLNDEVLEVRQRYQQLKNKREAVLRDLEQKQAAVGAIDKEMEEAFGISELEVDPLKDLIGITGEEVDIAPDVSGSAAGEDSETISKLLEMVGDLTGLGLDVINQKIHAAAFLLGADDAQIGQAVATAARQAGVDELSLAGIASAEMSQDAAGSDESATDEDSVIDELDSLRIEEVVGPTDDDLRAMGFEFANDDDWEEEDEGFNEDIDDEIYDNFDIGLEDTDDGYRPVPGTEGDSGIGDAYEEGYGEGYSDMPPAAPGAAEPALDTMDDAFISDLFGEDAELVAEIFEEDESGLPTFPLPDDADVFDDAEDVGYDDADGFDDDNVDDVFAEAPPKPLGGSAGAADDADDDDDIPDMSFVDLPKL